LENVKTVKKHHYFNITHILCGILVILIVKICIIRN